MARASRRNIDFYFNLTLIICYILFGLLLLTSCSFIDSSEKGKRSISSCDLEATVKDLTGLDGCGKVLVLENGEKLIPLVHCATPPLSDGDEFILHKMEDGMKVTFSYEEIERMNICMAGKTVRITCISEVK